MAEVIMYSKHTCPFCRSAKALLDELRQEYTEIDLLKEPHRRDEMISKANGGHTVPQIFINDEHVGGCTELHALHEAGELVERLKG